VDELLYIIAFIAAIIGAFSFLKYGRSKQLKAAWILGWHGERKRKD
jgi:hypothetical protein